MINRTRHTNYSNVNTFLNMSKFKFFGKEFRNYIKNCLRRVIITYTNKIFLSALTEECHIVKKCGKKMCVCVLKKSLSDIYKV